MLQKRFSIGMSLAVVAMVLSAVPVLQAQGSSEQGSRFGGQPITGKIVSLTGENLAITQADGAERTIHIGSQTRITVRQPVQFSALTRGEFLGVAAKRESDGTLTAVIINILPSQFTQNARTFQRPMADGNVMTNAPISNLVTDVTGRTLTMVYNGGTATILVPDNAAINRITSADNSALVVGKTVAVRGKSQNDGSVNAAFISIDGN